jgi:protein disulfide-isomerase A1
MDTGITIAKCDVDQCNIPVEVYHIPTIKLYPAHKKNAPVEYFDKLTDLGQYVVFIKEEGSRRKRVQRTNSPSLSRGAKNKFLGLGRKK